LIVFDASSVVGAALKQVSIPFRALSKARHDDRLAMSGAVEKEIRDVLHRPKFASTFVPTWLAEIEMWMFTDSDWFDPKIRVFDCRDPKDNKYLELALAANASALVSSDMDLLSLHPWRGIPILRPVEYLRQP
jgi:uncharacterized protein